jgi:hypothetical protein
METGGTRNYEVHKDKERTEEESALEKEEEEKDDPMKALENRVLHSQREMADLDNLAEIQAMNRRHVQLLSSKPSVSADGEGSGLADEAKALLDAREAALERKRKSLVDQIELNEHGITDEEEALVRSIQFGKNNNRGGNGLPCTTSNNSVIVRLNEEDEKRAEEKRLQDLAMIQQRQKELDEKSKQGNTATLSSFASSRPTIKVKKRKMISSKGDSTEKKPEKNLEPLLKQTSSKKNPPLSAKPKTSTTTSSSPANALSSLLGGYGSDSDDSN